MALYFQIIIVFPVLDRLSVFWVRNIQLLNNLAIVFTGQNRNRCFVFPDSSDTYAATLVIEHLDTSVSAGQPGDGFVGDGEVVMVKSHFLVESPDLYLKVDSSYVFNKSPDVLIFNS